MLLGTAPECGYPWPCPECDGPMTAGQRIVFTLIGTFHRDCWRVYADRQRKWMREVGT